MLTTHPEAVHMVRLTYFVKVIRPKLFLTLILIMKDYTCQIHDGNASWDGTKVYQNVVINRLLQLDQITCHHTPPPLWLYCVLYGHHGRPSGYVVYLMDTMVPLSQWLCCVPYGHHGPSPSVAILWVGGKCSSGLGSSVCEQVIPLVR